MREGQIEDCVKAAGLNSMLWGGFCNPLIPVGPNSGLTKRLMDLFSVDVLVPVSDSPEIDALCKTHEYLRPPHHFGDPLFQEDWRSKKKHLNYLDTINIVDACWERDIRHAEHDFKSNCTLVRWEAGDPLANLFALQFGFYPDLGLLDDFENAFIAGMKARESLVLSGGNVEGALADEICPIGLTRLELFGHGGGRLWEDGIFIGDETQFEDVLSFWNLRATGARVKFLTTNHPARVTEFVKTHLNLLDNRPAPNPNVEDRIAIHYRRGLQARAQELLRDLKTTKGQVQIPLDELSWNGLNLKPTIYHFGWKRVIASQDESFGKPVVHFAFPEKNFLSPRPSRDDRVINSQQIAVSLDFFSDSGYPEHTLRPPSLRKLNDFYSRAIAVNPWALRVEKDGVAVLVSLGDQSESLYPLSHQALIEKILDLAGIKAQKSRAGLLATQIIKSMREFSPLEACRVFKVRGVRKLIADLAPGSKISWKDAMKVIGSQEFGRFKGLYIAPRTDKELVPSDIITFLLEKRVLEPRLNLLERVLHRTQGFKCVECGLESTIPLSAFEGAWRCPYCEHEQYLPQYIDEEFPKKDSWSFMKRGLFAKENNQEGAIPVLLTLLALLRVFEHHTFVHSTSLNLKFERQCETDLCILQYHSGDGIEIAVGECKSRGRINAQDVANLRAVRDKLERIGLRCYLVFAKAEDAFSPDEIRLFQGLKAERIPFVLFTNREMEPYHPYWDEDAKSGLPFPYAATFSELSLNSESRYLPRS